MKRNLTVLLLLLMAVAGIAQNFVVFSVRGNVRRIENGNQSALNLRDKVKGSDVIDIPARGALVLIDEKSGVQISLTKPGRAAAKAMAQEKENTVTRLSANYLAYIRAQLGGNEYRQVRNCSDPATVTRELNVADNEGADAYEDFRIAFNSAKGNGGKSLQDQFEEERRKMHDNFYKERARMYQEFEDFRRECMEQYLSLVAEPWDEASASEDVRPKEPNIVPPVVAPDNTPKTNRLFRAKKVREPEPVQAQPLPPGRVQESDDADCQTVPFTFFGTNDRVRFNTAKAAHLKDISQESVAGFLKALMAKQYDNLLVDCLTLRSKYQLSDWAYLQMLRAIGRACYGEESNEAVVLMAYLYCQSGYKMRLGHDGQKMHMLFATTSHIFDRAYITIDGDKYYGVEPLPQRLVACKAKYPREQQLSLDVSMAQQFAFLPTEERTIVSETYPDLKVETCVNQNLLDFYTSYPTSYDGEDVMSRWYLYASSPMQRELSETLYPQLRQQLEGLSTLDKAERILNLVQTGLTYVYDEDVWGDDRAFFAEESLFYPGCDCEDRSILLTRIIRDLLGLKCLLVHYPGHLATAIHFDEDVQGDYIMYKGEKYTVCDPTYIRANVGMTMPDMDNSEAEVILLK